MLQTQKLLAGLKKNKSEIVKLIKEKQSQNKKAFGEWDSPQAAVKNKELKHHNKTFDQFQDIDTDKIARKNGWLILQPGEAYEMILNRYRTTKKIDQVEVGVFNEHSIYLFKESNGWIVWRASWKLGNPQPLNERCSKPEKDFQTALSKANNYIRWWQENQK